MPPQLMGYDIGALLQAIEVVCPPPPCGGRPGTRCGDTPHALVLFDVRELAF
jgi:hypothetical protein